MEATPPVPGWPSTRAIRGGLPNRLQFRYRGPAACGRVCPSTRARTSQWCLAEVCVAMGWQKLPGLFVPKTNDMVWYGIPDTPCKLNHKVKFCVDILGARRIAHGVLSMEDEELIQHLAKLQVCQILNSLLMCVWVFENWDMSWLLKDTSWNFLYLSLDKDYLLLFLHELSMGHEKNDSIHQSTSGTLPWYIHRSIGACRLVQVRFRYLPQ